MPTSSEPLRGVPDLLSNEHVHGQEGLPEALMT